MLRFKNHCCNQQSSHLAILICICILVIVQYAAAATVVVGSMGLPLSNSTSIKSGGNQKQQSSTTTGTITRSSSSSSSLDAGTYEIRAVSGEPNYKSVNLTWEVEFVPASNETDDLPPPKSFQIFYCEMQSFGPHRCRSKVVDDSQLEISEEPIRHYTARVDNLRMATKYSFHIKPQQKRKNPKITGRSELIDNEIENDAFQGQTIMIPTKGFSAQATKCLPHASEIEVETGPYFGGKIVVDGGTCGIKGNPKEATDKYVMRIDHKMCGSLVKPETNTVETFITVQENLGIFTHSTRRFVVVCSFQSGMQTVRASFTIPGKGGVAAAVENDPFEPDRMGREYRQMKFVDKSGLVLKESGESSDGKTGPDIEAAVATVEDIIPGINEVNIKHEFEPSEPSKDGTVEIQPIKYHHHAQFAKLIHPNEDERGISQGRASNGDGLKSIASNVESIVLTVSLSVIMLGVFIYVLFRESRRQTVARRNLQELPKNP